MPYRPARGFINTLLQRGMEVMRRAFNRFNGFLRDVQTVETVPALSSLPNTPLKRGVNGKWRKEVELSCEKSRLGVLISGPLLLATCWANGADIYINDFMAAQVGAGALAEEHGQTQDRIALRDESGPSIDLTVWHLTDESNQPSKWTFPDINLRFGGYWDVSES